MTDLESRAPAYAALSKRVRAACFDTAILALLFFPTWIVIDVSAATNVALKVVLYLIPSIPMLVIDLGFVAVTGGTIGHHLFKVRVIRKNGGGNISFLAATIRFVVKMLLGWTAFIFIQNTGRHQALHDMAAGSIVIDKTPN
ncbi:MAG TPA: RDD family protein [Methylophilaceae bacterium]|jgi:uncharacterized RDD family membrane protein YckC